MRLRWSAANPDDVRGSRNLETALKLMLEAAYSHPRILKDPAPTALLTAFGDNGAEMSLPGVNIGTMAHRNSCWTLLRKFNLRERTRTVQSDYIFLI